MTISAALRLGSCLSSILTPTGMPRPLSVTEMELSAWMVMTMSSQWPARASSMELSTTSNTMWCRPVPSGVADVHAGRLRTAFQTFELLDAGFVVVFVRLGGWGGLGGSDMVISVIRKERVRLAKALMGRWVRPLSSWRDLATKAKACRPQMRIGITT